MQDCCVEGGGRQATRLGVRVAPERWEMQGNGLAPGASRKEMQYCPTLMLAYWTPVQLSTYGTKGQHICIV